MLKGVKEIIYYRLLFVSERERGDSEELSN